MPSTPATDAPMQIENGASQTTCSIVGNIEVAPLHFRLTFAHREIARTARAGHFVHILPRGSSGFDPLLRRAFSIVSADTETFDVLFKVVGKGTAMMRAWDVGQKVDLIGPLGTPFVPLNNHSILVGGGVGTPPMAMLASQAQISSARISSARISSAENIMAIVGARTGSDVLCLEDFAKYNVAVKIATDDGSLGHHGFVTDLLRIEFAKHQDGTMPVVYACGPLPMLKSVAQICAEFGASCQVSLEENMPCGIGVCNGCVIPVLGQSDDYGSYRRICVNGPVAWAHEVDWAHWDNGAVAS